MSMLFMSSAMPAWSCFANSSSARGSSSSSFVADAAAAAVDESLAAALLLAGGWPEVEAAGNLESMLTAEKSSSISVWVKAGG